MADMKFRKLYDFRTTLYLGVFGVADCEFQIGFLKSSGFQNIMSTILGPPFWIPKIRCQIGPSGPKSFWVQSFAVIVSFPKLHVRNIGYPPFCEGYD